MANNYTMFSIAIGMLTDNERTWIRLFHDLSRKEDKSEFNKTFQNIDIESCWGFREEVIGDTWHIYSEESGWPENVCKIIHQFLADNRPGTYVTFTWAETCSKPRPGEFGGGAAFISDTGFGIRTTGDLVGDMVRQWEEG